MPNNTTTPSVSLEPLRESFLENSPDRVAHALRQLVPKIDRNLHEKCLGLFSRDVEVGASFTQPWGDLTRLVLSIDWDSGYIPPPSHLSSINQDFIAQLGGVTEWSSDQFLTRILLENIPVRRKAAAITTARDDGMYILEWLAHHRALGFSHAFVFTNDNSDGSDVLLDCLACAGLITVVTNEVTGAVPPEAKAFGYALNLLPHLWQYEWAIFLDSDEFFVPAVGDGFSIENVLHRLSSSPSSPRLGSVIYDWLWVVSDMTFDLGAGLLCERFQHARQHHLGKCFSRLRDTLSMRRQHCPDLVGGKIATDSLLRQIDLDSIWDRRLAEYSGGSVYHYWPKSFEEFAIKKARGASLGGEDNIYDRPFSKFFEWNGRNSQSIPCAMPVDWINSIHLELNALRSIPGVALAEENIRRGFHQRLNGLFPSSLLRDLFEQSRVDPGNL